MTSKEVRRHNEAVYTDLEVGDLLEFKRGMYSHWALFIGNSEVIHLSGEDDDGLGEVDRTHIFTISGVTFDKAIVRRDNFWDVAGDDMVYKNNSNDSKWKSLPPSQIVERALSKIGRVGYNLIFSNCEHFVKWCRYNMERSDQVESYATGLAVGGAIAAVVGVVAWLGSGSKDQTKERKSEH
ncbi:phospholipase A and acyltransferase 3-like [Haliotis rubra]|uniref:phospholipase A and acyltransferase 3-like n=1 Tax=Haliotis rubra TaxID=36100 RepID=UPI001EE52F7D|nr:phospholipase A and acyltransferase 3-like [Haliotis rubra]XP_046566050.1 phospholipase A and acyltransferase 3-like [Haliotis rubra]XP_046566051.1 phospholipase A and acyltransferase 3-like [Haliotis rubra]XP_046566053.1 phospholipase A and acyltransferase 3-like [Haliotis rubra]XP_046566054.1 phospholipase A and acyltransferase 3-like [Haliotis rubra]XP_046566055.1 phospholipase A and acyltransferase 3-like [Haliotis rubra]